MIRRLFFFGLAACAGLVMATAAAHAHPHVWVTVKSELVYAPDGTVTGVRHAWTFDDMFSTFATQGFEEPPAGYYLDFNPKDTVLTLHFTLPLKAPVKAKDLALEVYDREFFVDFSFAEKDPVKLVGAPAQCKLSIGRPQEMGASLTQQLSKLGADQRDPSLTIGAEYANKILVKCP